MPRLQQMQPGQIDSLVRWLVEEKLTYAQARSRLKAEFGVAVTLTAISHFWHEVVLPRRFSEAAAIERAKAFVGAGRLLLEIQVRAEADNTLRITVSGGTAAENQHDVH